MMCLKPMTNYCGLISRCKRRRIREFIRPIAMIPLSPPMERTWREIREVFSRAGPMETPGYAPRRNQQRKSIINESAQATDRS
jgi:hypothetical protein